MDIQLYCRVYIVANIYFVQSSKLKLLIGHWIDALILKDILVEFIFHAASAERCERSVVLFFFTLFAISFL